MGQKVNPIGLRLGINRTWDSRWVATKTEYATLLHEDLRIRAMLMKMLKQAAISKIVIGGTNVWNFAQTNTCGTSVPAGGNCSISVTFTPSSA